MSIILATFLIMYDKLYSIQAFSIGGNIRIINFYNYLLTRRYLIIKFSPRLNGDYTKTRTILPAIFF